MIYIIIFTLKLIENSLSTIRMIILNKRKKFLGGILQFVISLIWVLSVSLSITNIKDSPLKILSFSLGCGIGSIIGSIIEEKLIN